MDMTMIRKNWSGFGCPFKAKLTDGSNGFVEVVDGNGRCLCTCFSGDPAHNATGIAAALNLIFGKTEDEAAEAEVADEEKII